ncbi:sulfite exporter TauE/SafE family protein [uncultured Megasphaera sp.]|uniref:sulfite exporter TauE/SafE family protein n=1 Tax=uncultured Megasphaera sp. TaxID=165188 RepID=UPI00265A1FE8|nr:sulfite exporter TauE/SafE family protein [uncultured Megasphaera sp.]
MIVTALLGLLGVLFLFFLIVFIRDLIAVRHEPSEESIPAFGIIGLIANFFDTLGIGSYAPTTAMLNVAKQVKNDKKLPGILTVGCTVPVLTEAFLFIQSVEVEPVTLFALIISSVIGAAVGGKLVTKLPEQKVQLYLGIALVLTAFVMLGKQLGLMDFLSAGNTEIGLSGVKLVVAVVFNFIFGALMTIGCGLYAPCMAMIYMLGLNPLVAFPVMMGSCAALMPVAAYEFIKARDYAPKGCLAMAIGGVIGVFLAAKLVTSMDLYVLTWLVICVVLYTGVMYVRRSTKKKDTYVAAQGTDQ